MLDWNLDEILRFSREAAELRQEETRPEIYFMIRPAFLLFLS